jgi:hypothetical protein
MSVLEVTPVDDLDLADFDVVPPCECYIGGRQCSKPSEFRIFSICVCGNRVTIFICRLCHYTIINGFATCGLCAAVRGITEYRLGRRENVGSNHRPAPELG